MKIINLEQGSDEWKSWRRTILTATDSPVILGLSPYTTAFDLYQRKLGLMDEQEATDRMKRGSELEPIAREWFSVGYFTTEPLVIESDEYNFLGASLDGISMERYFILEIKCNGPKNHGIAQLGELPPDHFAQVQHQLICTRAEKAYYLSYTEEEKIVIEVEPDPDFEKYYMPIATRFWRRLIEFDPPLHFIHNTKLA